MDLQWNRRSNAACLLSLVLAAACAKSMHPGESVDAGAVQTSDAQTPDVDSGAPATMSIEIDPEPDALSAGVFHNCALRSDESIACWTLGMLRPQDDHGQEDAPNGRFVDLSSSWSHSCALDAAGAVTCWGRSASEYHGQADPPLGEFVKVWAGEELSCALDREGRPTCWGLGMGTFVPFPGVFVQLSVDWTDVCGLAPDGEIECTHPVLDAGAPAGPFAEVALGMDHACGRRADGSVECWGDRRYGQLDGPHEAFARIDACANHTCGIRQDGTLACWGFDTYGGSTPPSGSFRRLSTGRWHGCGERTTGEIVCWGFGSERSVPAGLQLLEPR